MRVVYGYPLNPDEFENGSKDRVTNKPTRLTQVRDKREGMRGEGRPVALNIMK